RARWRPAPLDRAEEHLATLTAALPAPARAHLWDAGPDEVARACVLAPLELLTDAVARRLVHPTEPDPDAPTPAARLALALTSRHTRVDETATARLRGPLREWRARVRGS